MPYVVKRGRVEHGDKDGKRVFYELGEEVPAMKGALSDMVEAGSVEWQDSRKAAKARKAAEKAAGEDPSDDQDSQDDEESQDTGAAEASEGSEE